MIDFFRKGTAQERAVRFTLAAMVLLGVGLRARGYLFSTIALWLDEADWAIRLIERPLRDHLIRPIGFMALAKAIITVFGPSEAALRFLSWSAGTLMTIASPFLARRLYQSAAAQLLFVGVLSLDPAAIDLAKEFKPYSVGLAMHAGMLFLALRYARSGAARDLGGTLAVAFFAVLFGQDAIFAYPGLFTFLALEALRARRTRHMVAILTTATLVVAVIGSLYVFIWSQMNKSEDERYWGAKYNIFYVPGAAGSKHLSRLSWLAGRYADMAELPAQRREFRHSTALSPDALARVGSVEGFGWLALHVLGLVYVARKRKLREALLIVLPIAVMIAFNALGFWPFGPFRANLFTLVYVAALAGFGAEHDADQVRFAELLPVAVLVLLPLFAFERVWHAQKTQQSVTMPSDLPAALEALMALQGAHFEGRPERLVTDTFTCRPWDYYTKYNPRIKATIGPELRRRFRQACAKFPKDIFRLVGRETKSPGPRAWILLSNPDLMPVFDRHWPKDLAHAGTARIGDDLHVVYGAERRGD